MNDRQTFFYRLRRRLTRSIVWLSLAGGLLLGAQTALAAPSQCAGHYAQGQRPDVPHQGLAQYTEEICMSGYAVLYSGITKTPLWSAYYLTPERVQQAAKIKRVDRFIPYTRLAKTWRAELEDYRSTGMDRGHLAPFAIMSSDQQGVESFYLINIVPQHAAFNRGEWSSIEARVRNHAKREPIYVITGALFLNERLEQINGRVLAPSHMYKLVYSPRQQKTTVFVATNQPKTHVRLLSAHEFEAFTRQSVALPAFIKNTPMLHLHQ